MKELYLDDELFTGTEKKFLAIRKFRCKEWYQNGLLHRIDGPAIIHSSEYQAWYQNGKIIKVRKKSNEKVWEEIYFNEFRQKHRLDGPAVIYSNGYQLWYQNGELHRVGGPAVIWPNGYQEYWQNGNLHRTDGPSIINIKESVYYFHFEGLDFDFLFPINRKNGLYVYNKK